LHRLLADVAAERKRLHEIPEDQLSLVVLHRELAATSLDLTEDAIKETLAELQTLGAFAAGLKNYADSIRAWASNEFSKLAAAYTSHEERFDQLESSGNDTQLLPEHAEMFSEIIKSVKTMTEALLAGTPIQPPSVESDRQQLRRMVELCDDSLEIIGDSVLVDAEFEGDDESEGPPAPPGLSGVN